MSDPLRLLVVDDNELIVKTLVDIFQIKGYQAEAAFTGLEALKKIGSDSFDCILSDLKMSDISGVELFRAVKIRRPDLPFVLMTAYAADQLIESSLKEGIVGVMTKPLDINLLLDFLSSLDQKRSGKIKDDDPEFHILAEIRHQELGRRLSRH